MVGHSHWWNGPENCSTKDRNWRYSDLLQSRTHSGPDICLLCYGFQQYPWPVAPVEYGYGFVRAPAAPSGLTGTAARIPANNFQDSITLTWTDNANNENNFQIEVANNPAFTGSTTITVGANLVPAPSVVTFNQNGPRPRTYYFRVRATNLVGNSEWNVFGH